MWEVWLALRLAEQERQAHLKLSTYTPPATPSPLSLWRDVSSGNNSISSYNDSTQGVNSAGNSAGNSGNNIGIAGAGAGAGVATVSPAFSPKTGDVKALGSAVVADTVEVLSSVMSALSAQVNSSTTTNSATTSASANSSTSTSYNSNSQNNANSTNQTPSTAPTAAPTKTKTVEVDEFNLDEAEEWLNSTSTAPSSNNNPLSNFSLAEDFDESEWESANTFLDKFSPTTTTTKDTSTHTHHNNKDSSTAAIDAVDEILAGNAVATPVGGTVAKSASEVVSKVHGRSQILTPAMIQQIEQVDDKYVPTNKFLCRLFFFIPFVRLLTGVNLLFCTKGVADDVPMLRLGPYLQVSSFNS